MSFSFDDMTDEQKSQAMQALGLLETMRKTPESRKKFDDLVKTVNKDAITSEDELKPYLSPLEEKLNEVLAFKATVEKSSKEWQEQEAFGRLKNQGYTEEGVDAIRKIMGDKGISDPEIAAAYFDKINPPKVSAPSSLSPSMWGQDELAAQMSEESFKELQSNPDRWEANEVAKVLNELAAQ